MIAATPSPTFTPTPTLTPSPFPTPSPTVSPVIHAVTHAAATHSAWLDQLNALASLLSPADVIGIAGALYVFVQSQINKLPWLQHEIARIQDLRRWTVAVALPFAGALVTSVATGHNTMHVAPIIFVASQIVFNVVKALKTAHSTALPDVSLATEDHPAG